MKKIFILILSVFITMKVFAQEIRKVEPPQWWIGMEVPTLQLLVYGNDIAKTEPEIKYKGIKITKVNRTDNPNYLFIDILIDNTTQPGKFPIMFKSAGKIIAYDYELFQKEKNPEKRKGFDQSDVIYLLMPDRFANGDPSIDSPEGILEKINRNDHNGRHGGDLKGISDNLDYLVKLGVTALWLNPVFENNMPKYSYHGYAITDFYKVDARFGTNAGYKKFVDDCHKKGLKVIKDMIFNHSASEHWFIKDLPSKDWIHQFPEFTRSNYKGEVTSDPYASERDAMLFQKGWFDYTMPDLNQRNPFLANYLIQNSLWWIEYAGIDGIRMDTYPYPYKEMMASWVQRVLKEYPAFNIVGESWLQKESHTAYWQKNFKGKDGYNSFLPSVTDFPLYSAVIKALNQPEGWTGGLSEIYYVLCQDFLYSDASLNLIFPDNHDVDRIYSALDHNFNKFKMAMSFFMTTRGIPQIYYGTEILMDGLGSASHGYLRQDFPGGWPGDKMNAFTRHNLSVERIMALEFMTRLLNWRKHSKLVHKGKLKHFIPENGTYVYFRYDDTDAIMVILSKKDAHYLNTARYNEIIGKYKKAKDVITGEEFDDLGTIWLEGFSARILELKN
jgi:neopullulanase